MSGLRFKAGDPAILTVGAGPTSQALLGSMVTVLRVGPFKPGDTFEAITPGYTLAIALASGDYVVSAGDNKNFLAMDWQLRKIDPPAEPASLTRESECEVSA